MRERVRPTGGSMETLASAGFLVGLKLQFNGEPMVGGNFCAFPININIEQESE